MKKKLTGLVLSGLLAMTTLVGCGGSTAPAEQPAQEANGFNV